MTIKEQEAGWSWAKRKDAKRARMQDRRELQSEWCAGIVRQTLDQETASELERFAFRSATATATATKAETATIDRLELDRKAERIYNAIMQARTW
jgi:hypothetical protein